jgi:hypothetical protein
MKWFALRAAAVALATFLLAPGSARASGWVPGDSGNVVLTGTPTSNGIVNYAVYNYTGASTTLSAELATLGLTSNLVFNNPTTVAAMDPTTTSSTTYLYFYQVVNNQPVATGSGLTQLFLGANPAQMVSAGVVKDATFSQGGNPVGPSTNQTLNGNPDATPFVTGAPAGTVGAWTYQGPESPGGVFFGGAPGPGAVLAPGQYGYLMVVASNVAPVFGSVALHDGVAPDAVGLAPVPTPEPGTFALIGLGLPLLGWGYARRLRARKALGAIAA